MKAVTYDQFGGPDVLRMADIPEPKIAQNSVMIRVVTAGVNPADAALRAGAGRGFMDTWFPVVPGWDVAGVVEAVGAGVHEFATGDEVIGYLYSETLHSGAYAEWAVGPAERFTIKPAKLSWDEAAALPLAGLTAVQSLRALQLPSASTLLVLGASGGVGSIAAQLAVLAGHRVYGLASEANAEYLKALGIEPVIRDASTVNAIRARLGNEVDAVLDCAGRGSINLYASGKRSSVRIVSIAEGGEGISTVFARPNNSDLKWVAELADAGTLKIRVASSLPLEQAASAQELAASGKALGKVVLRIHQPASSH